MFKVVSVRRQESWDRWTWKHWPRSCKRARALWLQYLEQLEDQETAKGLEHFGCNILNNSRTKKSSVPYPCYSNVCELVANCEVLIICCELNDQTRHMISKEVL